MLKFNMFFVSNLLVLSLICQDQAFIDNVNLSKRKFCYSINGQDDSQVKLTEFRIKKIRKNPYIEYKSEKTLIKDSLISNVVINQFLIDSVDFPVIEAGNCHIVHLVIIKNKNNEVEIMGFRSKSGYPNLNNDILINLEKFFEKNQNILNELSRDSQLGEVLFLYLNLNNLRLGISS
jgi:hypothetical protein